MKSIVNHLMVNRNGNRFCACNESMKVIGDDKCGVFYPEGELTYRAFPQILINVVNCIECAKTKEYNDGWDEEYSHNPLNGIVYKRIEVK